MVSRKLMGAWAAFDFLLLVAGTVVLSLSLIWKAENPLLNLVITPGFLTGTFPHA